MSIYNSLLDLVLNNKEIGISIFVGLIGAAGHYKRTGRLPLGRLPLQAMRKGWKEVSTKYFTKDRDTDVPGLIVDIDPGDLEGILRYQHFESGDLYSYEYSGEILNLRRPEGLDSPEGDQDSYPTELHPRAFNLSDGRLLILAHYEVSRFEAWADHLKGTIFSWNEGRDRMKKILDGEGVEYEEIESEEESGIEVTS